MCGICGEIRWDGQAPEREGVARMITAMDARGPDYKGDYYWQNGAFGHSRLKIIDLSDASNQPMHDPEQGLTLVFNGCIYNYQALRQELIGLGYPFRTHGDTEVILKAYAAWGWRCVERFAGMFALAIREEASGRITLIRDRLGIKPLYYTTDNKRFRFASSLPALLQAGGVDTELDPVALHHFLTFHGVVPAPHTILKAVRKLPPASVTFLERDGSMRQQIYWSLSMEPQPEERTLSDDDWESRITDALTLAVQRRLVADLPVGVLLSGGLDSSLIVALLAQAGQTGLETFSIGFEGVGEIKGDEFYYSDQVARHFATRHHKLTIPTDTLLDNLDNTVRAMNEPMVSHDNVGFYLLSKEVSQHVRVVQCGQGADEVFAGYHWYPPLVDSKDALADYSRLFFDRTHAEYCYVVQGHHVGADHSRNLVADHFERPGAPTPLQKALRLDTLIMLVDDPVKRVDSQTMAWGLEARVPFLDHELVELAARLPSHLKLAEGGKGILKRIARRMLPAAVIDRPKGYFPVPALTHISGPVRDLTRELLTSEKARRRNLFRTEYIHELLAQPEHAILTPLRGSKLWQLALLEYWLQIHQV
ncbi:MAG: N-acetylglutaminylglutamine amidotransferase [Magnetococcales bacterium]|nr:N-acetylglutaminylglutamine amidotransferase [Magnetococcales bacterium]